MSEKMSTKLCLNNNIFKDDQTEYNLRDSIHMKWMIKKKIQYVLWKKAPSHFFILPIFINTQVNHWFATLNLWSWIAILKMEVLIQSKLTYINIWSLGYKWGEWCVIISPIGALKLCDSSTIWLMAPLEVSNCWRLILNSGHDSNRSIPDITVARRRMITRLNIDSLS